VPNQCNDMTHAMRTDRGDTLIEVLVAMTVLSLTSASLFTALATTARLAGRERAQVVVDAAVRSGTEIVVAASSGCVPGLPIEMPINGSTALIDLSVVDATGGVALCPETGTAVRVRVIVVADDGTRGQADVVLRAASSENS
jgi:prepilin-type N-terminal cleavage/methylation domain-containing protein